MVRLVVLITAGAAAYGFAMGSVHSLNFACRNLVKFPALLLTTAAVCALAYHVMARLITRRLTFTQVQTLSLLTFRDIAILLASLAPAVLVLAWVIEQPDYQGHLNEYPFFLGSNVVIIAVCGSTALIHRGLDLIRQSGLAPRQGVLIMTVWLGVSLFVGGQVSWWLRPFCGVSTIPAQATPFLLGSRPDIRGDTSFYMAVYHLLNPPPLSHRYHEVRW